MAKLNANTLLSIVAVNDIVVAGRMGGSQLANAPSATMSPGMPAHAGPEPTAMTRQVTALVDADYRDASRRRAGRSEVSPNVGGLVLSRPGHARTAVGCRWSLAKQQRFAWKRLFNVSAKRETCGR